MSADPSSRQPPALRLALVFATGFGSGFAPFACGTAGSAVALPLIWIWGLWASTGVLYALGCLVWTAISVWSADIAVRIWQEPDPARVTIDEVAGMFTTFIGTQLSWSTLLIGFLLFRLFDVVKPYPARSMERLPGGWGVTLDDLVAGLYAAAVLHLIARAGLL